MKITYYGHSCFAAEITPLIKIDHAAAKEKFRSKELTLHLLPIGGTHDF